MRGTLVARRDPTNLFARLADPTYVDFGNQCMRAKAEFETRWERGANPQDRRGGRLRADRSGQSNQVT